MLYVQLPFCLQDVVWDQINGQWKYFNIDNVQQRLQRLKRFQATHNKFESLPYGGLMYIRRTLATLFTINT